MILHRGHLESGLAEDLVGSADLLDVVVGDTHLAHLARLKQGDQPRGPALHIHRVVDPVHIDVVKAHTLQGGLRHPGHAVLVHFGELRGELGGNEPVLTLVGRCQLAEDTLRLSHSVCRCRVPKVQAGLHSGVEDGFQIVFVSAAAEDRVSAEHSCAPGPGSECYFSLFHICVDVSIAKFADSVGQDLTDLRIYLSFLRKMLHFS